MSRALLAERRFAPLFACQFLSAFGDNFLRNSLGLLVVWSSRGAPGWIVAAASGGFVLPSVLLSGLGGQLAYRMDKAQLIRRLKFAEIAVAGVAWAPATGIAKVEVNVDNGPWQTATLAAADNINTWRRSSVSMSPPSPCAPAFD